jgi:hypothetical protein
VTYPAYEADLGYLEGFRDDGDEAVHLLEPLLTFRLSRAYRASRRLRDHLRIESAGRTRGAQQYLYDGYKAGEPGFNMAANPDRIIGRRGGKTFLGSWHMAQGDAPDGIGYVYAVDLTSHWHLDWDDVHDSLRASGLHTTVPGEPWHHQATTIRGPLPGPFPDGTTTEDEMTPEMEERFDGLATWVFNGTTMILKRLEELAMQIEGTTPTEGDDE